MSRRKLPSRLSILALVAALFVSASAPASAQVNPALEMKALVEQGELKSKTVAEAIKKYGIDTSKPDPTTV